MTHLKISYGDPNEVTIVSNEEEEIEPKNNNYYERYDMPEPRLEIAEITEQRKETPPPMPSNEQVKQWRKEIEDRINNKNARARLVVDRRIYVA